MEINKIDLESAVKTKSTKGRSSTLQLLEFQVVIPNTMLDKEGKMRQVCEKGKHELPLVTCLPLPTSQFSGTHRFLIPVG